MITDPDESTEPTEQEVVIEIIVTASGFFQEELDELKDMFEDAGVDPDIYNQL